MDAKELLYRTKQFGYNCIDLCNQLDGNYLENHVRWQLIRSSTSVNANYRAARLAQSEASFIAKLSISIEEADESAMWIELIIDKNLLSEKQLYESKRLLKEASELTAIFIAIRKTINTRNKKNV
ncbi:MAG: four helix bundle protein [Bacteroidia bacterium]|nr:four helix bundle protein [Bacteroidia bacterium]